MTPRDDNRPPTRGEVFWGWFLMIILGLYLLVVVVRPLYDLTMGY